MHEFCVFAYMFVLDTVKRKISACP